jgi:phosphoglycolate phosphatase
VSKRDRIAVTTRAIWRESEYLMKPLVLFDIDGTLLKPGDKAHQLALTDAVKYVFELEISLEGVPLGGMLDSQIVRIALEKHGVPLNDIRAGLPAVMDQMGVRYLDLLEGDERRSWLLPGVHELVDSLVDEFVLSVLTGNASGVARAKLAAAGIDRYFPFGAYGDSADHRYELVPVAMKKMEIETGWQVEPDSVVIVGDTPRDIEAARESGTQVIAVATGRYSVDMLEEHEPDFLFSDLGAVDSVRSALKDLTSDK